MPQVYQNTDVGIFPSRCEAGTNLVMMEYMACGKPAIATVGTGLTVRLTVPLPTQVPLLTEMVYCVVTDGATIAVEAVKLPGIQVYALAEAVALNVTG